MTVEEYEIATKKINDLFCTEKVDADMLDIWYKLSDYWCDNEKEFYDDLTN